MHYSSLFHILLNKFIPTLMIPFRNSLLYRFPLSIFFFLLNCARHISSFGQWLQPSRILSAILCHPWSLFTVPANACSPSTFALEAQLDWHFAAAERMVHHKSDDRLAVQRQLESCSLASRVVHSEPTDSRAGANIAEVQKGGVQCYLL